MIMFLSGFLCCWVVLGALCFLADTFSWGIDLFDTKLGVLVCLPLLLIAFPFYIFYCFLIRPWRNVWAPVTQKRFDEVMGMGHSKAWKIFPRVYLCFEAKARLINKIFFVRVQAQKETKD